MRPKEWLAFGSLGLIWGSSFLWIKVAVQDIAPFSLVAWRLLFGFLGLATVVLLLRPAFPKGRKVWLWIALLGLTNTLLPFALITWGEQHVDFGGGGRTQRNRSTLHDADRPLVLA